MFKIFSLCLVALLAVAIVAADDEETRIIGGQLIAIDQVPYLVQLRDSHTGRFLCGGTLVKPTHVVTAAHCLDGLNAKDDLVVVGGATFINEKGTQRKVVESFVHPYYNDVVAFTHDAAVLKLDSPMEGTNIQTMKLCSTRDIPDNTLLQVSGWGVSEEGHISNQVRTVRVPTVPFDQCVEQYSYTRLSGTMLCASAPGSKDACQGDSGGPAVYNDELCGIVSWGRGCAQADYPGIYTNVDTVAGFLQRSLDS